jgi:hypothetical protein
MQKIIYSFIFLFIFSTTSIAQVDSIINGGFENWHTTPFNEPNNWYTLNTLTDVGAPETTVKVTDAHSGSSAVKLESKASPFNDIPGVIASGPILDGGNNPNFQNVKIPFKSKPFRFKFFYKSMPVNGDSCAAIMLLTKWNGLKTDTVAWAGFYQTQTITVYTLADAQFNYLLPSTPDSASIIFTSSKDAFHPKIGSVFIVDDVSVSYTNAGIQAVHQENNISVVPNPANDEITIHSEAPCQLTITDITGKEIIVLQINSNDEKLNTSFLQNGLYLFKLSSSQHIQHIVKVIIQH